MTTELQGRRASSSLLGTIALALLALALHWGVILARGFDGLYGQDAFAYYGYARQLLASLRELRAPPDFFWPPGYPAATAAGFLALGETPRVAQLISSLAGAGVVLLTAALGRELMWRQGLAERQAREVGLLAGLLAAVCGQLWQWSVTIMSDTLALFWATLAAWALLRFTGGWRRRWLLLASVALGLAIDTRWIYLLLVPLLALFWLMASAGRGRARLGDLLLAVTAGLAALAPTLLLELSRPIPFANALGHEWVAGWSPLNALRRQLTTENGVVAYPLPVALFYAKAALSPRLLVPFFTPLLLLGAVRLARGRHGRAALLLCGWSLLVYAFLSGTPSQNFRLTLALVPPEMVLTALGLVWLRERLAPRLRPLLAASVVAGLAFGLWYNAGVLDEFIDRKEADLALTRWVEQQAEPGARILAFGATATLDHYTRLEVHELFLLSEADLARLTDDGTPAYLLVPLDALRTQWAGYPPERNYRWLAAGPGLVEQGALSGYTLFRVQGTGDRGP